MHTSSGTAIRMPTTPHIQPHSRIDRNTATGLSARRWPATVGVMNWPSSTFSAITRNGGNSTWVRPSKFRLLMNSKITPLTIGPI